MNKKGFTLVEMIVSVFIITVAIVGIVRITTKYIQQTKFEKESYVAALLGQEGIEIVKNIRDNNWINGTVDWDLNISDGDTTADSYEADYEDTTLTAWSGSGTFLYIENTSKKYKYVSGVNDTKTIYTRKITIDEDDVNADKIGIVVDVYWRGNTTTIKEDIYNWKQ